MRSLGRLFRPVARLSSWNSIHVPRHASPYVLRGQFAARLLRLGRPCGVLARRHFGGESLSAVYGDEMRCHGRDLRRLPCFGGCARRSCRAAFSQGVFQSAGMVRCGDDEWVLCHEFTRACSHGGARRAYSVYIPLCHAYAFSPSPRCREAGFAVWLRM